MTLEFVDEVNEYGDQVVRLFDFNKEQAIQFRDALQKNVLDEGKSLDLSTLDFIQCGKFKLILHLSEEDAGIMTQDQLLFFCDLTREGYQNMIRLIEPFCIKEKRAMQLLYDLDNEIDFQFAPYGISEREPDID